MLNFIKFDKDNSSPELIKFLKLLFPEINAARWRWEYRENPEFRGLVYLATYKSKIIAHYAFIIGKYKFNNSTYKITLNCVWLNHHIYMINHLTLMINCSL